MEVTKEKESVMEKAILAQDEKMQKTIQAQQAKDAAMQKTLLAQHDKQAALEKTIQVQQTSIDNFQNTMATLNNDMSTMGADVANLRHVEHGVLDCSRNDYWKGGAVPGATISTRADITKTTYITTSFSTVYRSPPVVFLAARFTYIHKTMEHRYGIFLKDVDIHGFTMFCGSDTDADDRILDLEVSWISVPT